MSTTRVNFGRELAKLTTALGKEQDKSRELLKALKRIVAIEYAQLNEFQHREVLETAQKAIDKAEGR
jgi:hypothetical protein